ncbi:hypothetical protein TVNIR_3541 [Thioalkalivibrio nitratireducens DSM 14787]|uniref:Uncharacterized protein n=1 Tax=Thioalkalivibrio nitratireducens (strain DSM 14787 / UNIQEM 213 / ALEN2) TaxID=1255043 RepID=L0E3F2_THIND|nr:hypothetical protein TVNIR_3541 [Thioalkalivibrio nitratireducens DSM 14787]
MVGWEGRASCTIDSGHDGSGSLVMIPSGMVSLADGAALKEGLPATGTFSSNADAPPEP